MPQSSRTDRGADGSGTQEMASSSSVESCAARLAGLLARRRVRVVFAESCTAGLVAATVARTAGISQWLCGSAVTYRDSTKAQWLGVSDQVLQQQGAVSAAVAAQMARGVLERTPEADFAWSVTGHLGPDAPESLDGVVFIANAARENGIITVGAARRIVLTQKQRAARQREAACAVLNQAVHVLKREGVTE